MAVTPVPPMTDIPPFPALSDRADGSYNSKAFAFGSHMADTFNDELTAVATSVVQNATAAGGSAATAATSAQAAAASAQAAVAASGVAPWVSGQSYALNACAISQVNFQAYRRIVAGAGTTDPASDTTNWVLIVGSATNGAFVPVAVPASNDIDLRTGNYFTLARSASTTVTFSNCPSDGYSFTIKAKMTTGALVLPSNVYLQAGSINTMDAGKTHRIMLVTEDRGAHWAAVIAANFDF